MPQSKIDTILTAIREEAARQQNAIERQTEQKMKDELARAEAEVLQETYDMIKRRSAAIREAAGRQISQQEQSARRSLFQRRGAIMDEVFDAAAARLGEFAASADYPAFLEASARRIAAQAGDAPVTLFVRAEDLPLAEGFQSFFSAPVELKADPSIALGGLCAEVSDRRLRLDDTLATRLNSQRQWFMTHSGMTISEA